MAKLSKIVGVALGLALAAGTVGCKADKKSSSSTGTTKLSFWTFQNAHAEFMKDAAETWNKQNPNEQIELSVEVLGYDEMHNKLLIALQSGSGAPDISDIEIGKFANYLKGKNPPLVKLNDLLDMDHLIKGRFNPYTKNGNIYGVDYHVGAAVIYYNKEILDQAGVSADDIKTWDDFYRIGKIVVQKTGKPMTTVESTEHWSFYPLIAQQGGDFLDKDGNGALDSEINIKTLEYIVKLVDEGIAQIAPAGFHHSEEYWSFMNNGGAASIWMPLWYMNRFTDYMPKLSGKIIVRPMPRWTPDGARSAGLGGTGTAIPSQGKHTDLASRFMVYAKASKEGSIKTWTLLGFDPIRWDAWSDPAMKAPNKFTAYFGDGVFDMLVSIKDEILGVNGGDKFPEAQSLVQKNVMYKVLGERSATPREALVEANKILNSK